MTDRLNELVSSGPQGDRALIIFASPEERCMGIAKLAHGFTARIVVILRIDDEPNEQREENIKNLCTLLGSVGPVKVVNTTHEDPLVGLDSLIGLVSEASGGGQVVVDVSTFPKNALLLTLRALEQVPDLHGVRAVYSEPAQYRLRPVASPVFGLRRIGVVPTFGATFRPNEELVLIMLLGYERDRAIAMWQGVQPHRTLAAVSGPSYRAEWDGIAEKLNAALLAAIGEEGVHVVDPRDPWATYRFLKTVVPEGSGQSLENVYVAPLGTKPQTVGVYLYCRDVPDMVSVIYGAPVAREHEYLAVGIGPSWTLTQWETSVA
jgi:hypothetical protein